MRSSTSVIAFPLDGSITGVMSRLSKPPRDLRTHILKFVPMLKLSFTSCAFVLSWKHRRVTPRMIQFSKAPMSRRFRCVDRIVTLETCRPIASAHPAVPARKGKFTGSRRTSSCLSRGDLPSGPSGRDLDNLATTGSPKVFGRRPEPHQNRLPGRCGRLRIATSCTILPIVRNLCPFFLVLCPYDEGP